MPSSFFTPKSSFQQKGQLKIGMSLAMRQSLQILQMPIGELTVWLNQAITENPLLEWNEKKVFEDKKTSYYQSVTQIADSPSLFSHLMNQARLTFSCPKHLHIAEWIIGNVEPSGVFIEPFSSIPFDCREEDFTHCLGKIKQFDPPGICAKDIQESLLLQLKALGKEGTLCFTIIAHDFETLLAKKFSFLQKKYSLSEDTFEKFILQDIAALDPFPGYRFTSSTNTFLPVDITFIPEDKSLPLEVLTPPLPSQKTISTDGFSVEEKSIYKSYQTQAHQIISAVKKRSHTLQKVTRYLVKVQKDYLEGNSDTLNPLSIQTVAVTLNLHESTITRALADKNLSCPRGVIPLKSLLSKELSEDVSCDKAKKLLKKLIEEENKQSPLSDRELLEKLKDLGIPCARRTLTKYRQALKIPSKKMRKAYF